MMVDLLVTVDKQGEWKKAFVSRSVEMPFLPPLCTIIQSHGTGQEMKVESATVRVRQDGTLSYSVILEHIRVSEADEGGLSYLLDELQADGWSVQRP